MGDKDRSDYIRHSREDQEVPLGTDEGGNVQFYDNVKDLPKNYKPKIVKAVGGSTDPDDVSDLGNYDKL